MSAADPPNPDDPIKAYLERMAGSSRGKYTMDSYKTALNFHLRNYLQDNQLEANDMTLYDCENLLNKIESDPDISTDSARGYAISIRKFYAFYNSRGTFEVNPMKLAMETFEFGDSKEKFKREITVPRMREFMQSITHPLLLAILMILSKTGIRNGELCNIDMRDVHIDDPRVKDLFPEIRPEIAEKPDSIYIERHADMQAGQITNGELRHDSNKRKRSTIIPIDEELKNVLLLFLAVRPNSRSSGEPFLTRIRIGSYDSLPGDRLTSDVVHGYVTNAAQSVGWWESDTSQAMNVTPHYFRHFFTTHMRERTSDRVFIQFIRGDSGDAAIDDYTHNWNDKVRTTYSNYIYKFNV